MAVLPPIDTASDLFDRLSEPTPAAVAAMANLKGDLLILGVGGKMGPTLARMAVRASEEAGVKRRVIGVSRFSTSELPRQLNACGVETIACDLTNEQELSKLPAVPNVLFMAGMKFGATGNEPLTWLMNVHVPAMVCKKFPGSRMVAFSSGNVYGLAPLAKGGSRETDSPAPTGEYALTVLGRERTFEYFSKALETPTALLRLNYAVELHYGVLVDLALSIWNEQPINLAMGNFNVIWQGDANAAALAAFDHVEIPARILNIAGPEMLSVATVAQELGQLLGKEPILEGTEAADGILNNGQLGHQLWGYPRIGVRQMIEWIAHWIRQGGAIHGKPTHFESRDGKF